MTSPRPRALYLVVGFLVNAMLGTAYAWSVFTAPLKAEYGATDFGAMLPLAVALAMFSVGMVLAGRLVDRHGPRKVAILGGLLFGGGYLLSSVAVRTPWPIAALTLTYGVVVGLGTGFAYNPPIPTAVRWFPDRKGFASGIVVMGFGLSALLTAPLADGLIQAYGMPPTFLILGGIFLAVLLPTSALLAFPPADWKAPQAKGTSARTWTPLADVRTRDMLRSPGFWSAWLLYVLGTAGGFMIIGKAKPIAVEIGAATGAWAIAAVQILAVFNSGGRPLFGRAADAWGPRKALSLMFGVLLGSMVLLSVSTSIVPLYLGIGLTGMVFGGFLAVMPALSTYFFGTKHLGTNYGFLFTGYGCGALVALFAIGPIRDAFGTYGPAFYVGVGLGAIGLVMTLLVRPPRPTAVRIVPERAPVRA